MIVWSAEHKRLVPILPPEGLSDDGESGGDAEAPVTPDDAHARPRAGV